jgi:hypothetical protein
MTENKKLINIGARLAACLWDYCDICPECGNGKANHLPGCKKTYETEFNGPQDFESAFVKAFDIQEPK